MLPWKQLAAAGANSIRTWGGDDISERLDAAHALGLTVTVGIWLGHERHGFDYSDEAQVREQLEHARDIVLRYKDHPAVLLWGIGNEMEGFEEGDNPVIWTAVNDVAAMVKELDPNHPTMTVTAFVHGGRIEYLHRKSPAIDIHGVNAYGGAVVVPEFLRDGGATKPFVLTEFGPVGPWEVPKTEWGAPYEQTSTEKAAFYRRAYEEGVTSAPGRALGSYAFLWGHKMEATATWFGMFLDDGSRAGRRRYDDGALVRRSRLTISRRRSNRWLLKVRPAWTPARRCVLALRYAILKANRFASAGYCDPESGDYSTGGDYRPRLPDIEGAITGSRRRWCARQDA